jgi:hypothetical protein
MLENKIHKSKDIHGKHIFLTLRIYAAERKGAKIWRKKEGTEGFLHCTSFSHITLEMATGTRNPSTRLVLPDKEAGME